MPTAEIVLEVLSPDDETFVFYARRGVRKLLVAHPLERWVRCRVLRGGAYVQSERSELLDVDMTAVGDAVRWP